MKRHVHVAVGANELAARERDRGVGHDGRHRRKEWQTDERRVDERRAIHRRERSVDRRHRERDVTDVVADVDLRRRERPIFALVDGHAREMSTRARGAHRSRRLKEGRERHHERGVRCEVRRVGERDDEHVVEGRRHLAEASVALGRRAVGDEGLVRGARMLRAGVDRLDGRGRPRDGAARDGDGAERDGGAKEAPHRPPSLVGQPAREPDAS